MLTAQQARKVDALKRVSHAFATIFCAAANRNLWTRDRRRYRLRLIPIMRFASVLRRDIDAVSNAIELPWSNGQAEGSTASRPSSGQCMAGRS
jgi:transposase